MSIKFFINKNNIDFNNASSVKYIEIMEDFNLNDSEYTKKFKKSVFKNITTLTVCVFLIKKLFIEDSLGDEKTVLKNIEIYGKEENNEMNLNNLKKTG
jgi:hypothetical protein